MEGNALYRPILKKAWSITKKFKPLWFFGLFATILGSSGEYEMLLRVMPKSGENDSVISATIKSFQAGWENGLGTGGSFMANMIQAVKTEPGSIIFPLFIFLVALAIALFIIWLAIISEVGLIKNVALATKNKKSTINEGIDFAVTKFWPALGANALMKIATMILFVIIGLELSFLSRYGVTGTIIYYLSFIVFALVTFAVSFIFRYQLYYIVLGKQKVLPALKSGWQLFKSNWLVSYEMAFILLIISLLTTVVVVFASLTILSVPVTLPIYFSVPLWLAGLIALVAIVAILALNFFVAAFLTTFQWSCWTQIFENIDKTDTISKITRTAQELPTYFAGQK